MGNSYTDRSGRTRTQQLVIDALLELRSIRERAERFRELREHDADEVPEDPRERVPRAWRIDPQGNIRK